MSNASAADSFLEGYGDLDPSMIPDDTGGFFYPPNGEYNVQLTGIGQRTFDARDDKPEAKCRFFTYTILDGEYAGRTFQSDLMWPRRGDPAKQKAEEIAASQLKAKLEVVFGRRLDASFNFAQAMALLAEKIAAGSTLQLAIRAHTREKQRADGATAAYHTEYYRDVIASFT